MTVRTAEELSDRISEDFIWRKREITILKTMLASSRRDRKLALLRSLSAMLYAHWEGFIRNTSESYLAYLARRRLKFGELSSNFVALGLQRRLKEASLQSDISKLAEIVEFIRSGLNSRSSLPSRDGFGIQSNLTSKALRVIMSGLGLDYSFATKEVLIDERLVRARNCIAHGEHIELDESSVLELAVEVQEMMEQFRTLVENAVVRRDYCWQKGS